MTSEDFSDVYEHSGLQALFVTVFQTSVDLLCKMSYKSSSLLGHGYFDCFHSNHTVGCCNKNFSVLSQIRTEKICLASHVSLFCCTFLRDCSCFVATFGQLFTLLPLMFCFSWTRFAHSLLKNDFFFECSWIIFERGTENEKFSGKRGFQTKRQKVIFYTVLRSKSNVF